MTIKTIPVSKKHQITIPKEFFDVLKIDSEVDCILNGNEIILRPSLKMSGYFAQEIVNELVDKGLTGEELKSEFARLSGAVAPAVKGMMQEMQDFARESMNDYVDKTDEIFGVAGE